VTSRRIYLLSGTQCIPNGWYWFCRKRSLKIAGKPAGTNGSRQIDGAAMIPDERARFSSEVTPPCTGPTGMLQDPNRHAAQSGGSSRIPTVMPQ
jgi:hypothetical protein